MSKIYKARRSTRSTGFNMIAVSSFLSFGLFALLVMGLINNKPAPGQEPPLIINLLIFVLVFLGWLATMFAVARFMKNNPRTVQVEKDRLVVDGKTGRELELPLACITFVATTEVPVNYWKYQASFEGLRLGYTDPADGTPREYVLSSRDTTNFDELVAQLWPLAPHSRPRQSKS